MLTRQLEANQLFYPRKNIFNPKSTLNSKLRKGSVIKILKVHSLHVFHPSSFLLNLFEHS